PLIYTLSLHAALPIFFSSQRANHTGQGLSSGSVDADDECMSVRRSNEAQVGHIAQLDIIGKPPTAAEQATFFFSGQRLANPFFQDRKSTRLNSSHQII